MSHECVVKNLVSIDRFLQLENLELARENKHKQKITPGFLEDKLEMGTLCLLHDMISLTFSLKKERVILRFTRVQEPKRKAQSESMSFW